MTTTTTTNPITPGELVSAKTICLVLKIGSFCNTKQASLAGAVLSKDEPNLEPDKALLKLSKTLLDSPELIAVQRHDRKVATRIRQLAFTSMFKGGVYLLPLGMVTTAEGILTEAEKARKTLVDAACAMYMTRITETTSRLGSTARLTDYPSVERFKASFYMEYSYVTFETPTRLQAISAGLFEAETAKARVRLESVADECEQTMRAGLLHLVDHLAERMSADADGKPKRLAHSTIENLNDFLKVFELRNVTDDAQLGAIVIRARAVMNGMDHKQLKSDEAIRAKVLAELGELKSALDPLIVERPTRAITFDDDSEGV